MKLSQWHDGDVKPEHDGVYQRLYNENTTPTKKLYCKYENGKWYYQGNDKLDAATVFSTSCFQDEIKWRGIVK